MFKNPTLLYFCSTFILFYYSFYCSALLLSTYSTIIDIILPLPSLLNYDEFSIFATDKCTPLVREITFEVRLFMLVLVANFDNVIRLFIMSRADRRSQIQRFFFVEQLIRRPTTTEQNKYNSKLELPYSY